MMFFIFSTLLISMTLGFFHKKSLSFIFIIICITLSLKEFLWEIYSPEYGFRMPWIQTQLIETPERVLPCNHFNNDQNHCGKLI